MRRVFTCGVFDLLHIGHINLFRKARECGDYLIVAVQEDEWVSKFKPDCRLSEDYQTRVRNILDCGLADEVVSYRNIGEDVRNFDFDVFVKGPDQNHAGFQTAVLWCGDNGKRVVVIPRTEGISSSEERLWTDKECK